MAVRSAWPREIRVVMTLAPAKRAGSRISAVPVPMIESSIPLRLSSC